MAGGPIRIAILANGSQAKREVKSVGATFGRLGSTLKTGAAAAGLAGLTAGVVGLARSSISAEKQYSTTMRLIQASTKATAGEMAAMDKAAMELGANTQFSATEAADAMLELGKAGLDTKTILRGGVAGTLQLAAAGGTELGTAATIASNALNAFNLKGKDMAKVAAALAGGANASSASVESLGQGLQQVGPGAVNAGLSLQETVAALSAFDAAGIKGSDAGTSLKTMLARLVPQTNKAQKAMEKLGLDFVKGNGEFESLANIAGQLEKRMGKLSQAQRTVALNQIFGSDASRAASVLMKEGAKGVRDFTKATKDQNAAQEMAEARMSGTEGALEKLSGAVETAQLRLGKELAPAVQHLADLASDNLGPALDKSIDGAKAFGSAIEPLVDIGLEFGGMIGDVAGILDDLPGPLVEIVIQAGLAAAVFPRFSAAATSAASSIALTTARVRQFNAEMSYSVTRTQNVKGILSSLGSTAKNIAGVGGIMALTSGLGEASSEGLSFSSVMKGAAGGAGMGAMFGPIGALVGGAGGAGLAALTGALSDARAGAEKTRLELLKTEGFREAKADADTLAESLLGVVNAYGKVPRAAVEASFTGKDGKLDKDVAALRQLGVSMDTIVSATMGQGEAQRVVNAALDEGLAKQETRAATALRAYEDVRDGLRDVVDASGQLIKNGESLSSDEVDIYRQAWLEAKKPVEDLVAAQEVFRSRIDENTGAIDDHRAQMRSLAEQLGITIEQYRRLPKKVRTKVEGAGLPQTSKDALRLIDQYKGLQRFRTIKAVVSAPGVSLSEKQIRQLYRTYGRVPKQLTTLFKLEGVRPSEREASQGGRNIARNLKGETGKARADLGNFHRSVTTGTNAAKGIASQGGREVGSALKAGVIAGFSGTQEQLSAQAASAVRAAVASAKAAGRVRSPSRETYYIGDMLGRGLVLGLSDSEDAAKDSGKDLVTSLLAGVVNGADGVDKALEKITGLVERRVKRKKPGAEDKAEKRVLKHLADEYAALRRNGRQQAKNTEELKREKDALEALVTAADDYKAGIVGSFAEFGNLLSLGERETAASNPWAAGATAGGRTIGTILEDLRARAAEATEFNQLMTQLQGSGLNGTTVQQLLAAGPEAALSTAEAIASGGAAAVAEINSLTATIGDQGDALGDLMREQFHGAGIAAVEGIVTGLEADQAALDKAAKKLAKALTKAVKKELGIASPSRVFREIGGDTVKGLAIGLDDTYVKRQGQQLAQKLTTGFGTPALDAYVSTQTAPAAISPEVQALAEQVSALTKQMQLTSAVTPQQQAEIVGAAAGAHAAEGFKTAGTHIARRRRRDY